ncbi:hypothetical protein LEN26_008971 [Aphanomyces euteiches]|nr:hypothetical protein LEN26_008971 [Aphanomyces euteiches]KAH9189424.1 hypothetical protein AeNC1_008600 [Aphanomyces euteiches]
MLLYYRANSHMNQRSLALWAMKIFGLPCPPTQTTVVMILKNELPKELAPSRRSSHKPFYPAVEAELMTWISKADMYEVPVVTGEMLRYKADQIRTRILAGLSPNAHQDSSLSSAQFSKGWLY